MGYKMHGTQDVVQDFIKALGLEPSRVANFNLIIAPGEIVRAEVVILLEDDQLQMAGEVMKNFELKEKET